MRSSANTGQRDGKVARRRHRLEMRHQPAQRSSPDEPFIDVAQQNDRHLIGVEHLQQASYLLAPFRQPQAQMRGDHA